MHISYPIAVACLLAALSLAAPCLAEDSGEVGELKQMVKELQQQMTQMQEQHTAQIQALEEKIATFEEQQAQAQANAQTEAEWTEALAGEEASNSRFLGKISGAMEQMAPASFLDISANVDMLGHLNNREDSSIDDEWKIREVEVGLGGAVDPYGRFDIFIGMHPGTSSHTHATEDAYERLDFRLDSLDALADALHAILDHFEYPWHQHEEIHHPWAFHVEEVYFTFDKLPHNLQLKLGKFRASFGKANTQHRHALPWVDYPRMVEYFFGGEGLAGTGASLSWLVPNRWDHYLELTYEAFKNDSDSLFAGSDADDIAHLVHIKNFWETSPASTLELGLTASTAPNNSGHGNYRSWIEGIDLTYKWRPLDQGLYKSFLWTSEAFFVQQDLEGDTEHSNSWGMYSAMDYQFARRWTSGLRYDYAEWPDEHSEYEHDYSVYLTFLQSEYAFWRLGYMHRDFSHGSKYDDDELFLQLNVSLGTHPAHAY